MYFAYIAIFTKQKETMERLVYLFSEINQMEPNLELDLHQILKKMIKFHFRENENKIKELLTMISESIFQKNLEGLTYKERTEIQIKEKDRKLKEKDQKLKKENKENQKLKKEIEKLKKQINR